MIKLNNLRKDYKSGNNTTTIVDISHLQFDKGAKVTVMFATLACDKVSSYTPPYGSTVNGRFNYSNMA